jgi:hypothetical protein
MPTPKTTTNLSRAILFRLFLRDTFIAMHWTGVREAARRQIEGRSEGSDEGRQGLGGTETETLTREE